MINKKERIASQWKIKFLPLYTLSFILLVGMKLASSALLSENEFEIASEFAIFPKTIDAAIFFLAILGLSLSPPTKRKWLFITYIISILITGLISQFINERSIAEALFINAKLLGPMTILAAFLLNQKKCQNIINGIPALLFFISFLIIAGFFLVEPSFRNGKEWSPAYFSGTHTSAYVALSSTAIAVMIMKKPWYKSTLTILIAFFVYMIAIGWGVRTATMGLLVSATYLFLVLFQKKYRPTQILGLTAIFTLILFYLLQFSSFSEIEKFSSGRTTEWLSRLSTISERPTIELLFGTGLGSNVTFSSVWWWEEKDSHNDIIRILYEQGLAGLTLVAAMLIYLYLSVTRSHSWNAIWLYVTVSAVLSNGIISRPTASYVFVLALIVSQQIALYRKNPIPNIKQFHLTNSRAP
ncbi:O-antigen ligase family protein [Marichromatium bheemlicum]|uniref:O-antigen ligase n=1 Tax=Marichromatium bheemlicum TaxID=365339 RepID=A0ABX1IC05_9GAMM|nr:hypothetical protein [Marichromatium bheemlicum]NKN34559.1 hypothetical protein [Marichromatium bheemlicum]